ncbi:pig-S [Schizosaccharomyces cryophilus OY26]|uniref:Pig-S n=1 Tax=Schizosaccharomyces cryophilus (strain OY26 / ATCC MYA-4695 / CBS 11777 / NBRC 106824 / NRRL Y48691) TaxID=653667 RepID=S9XCH1_SCHCR|nr:pig-S [Schizosaccharomyces cryophilus OY26]EPY51556.1 pig-S [Schizosaccharomyces cryophilus OY26]
MDSHKYSRASKNEKGKEKKDFSNDDSKLRRYIMLTYYLIILLGIPIWWKTTTYYRASLPFYEMENTRYQLESNLRFTPTFRITGDPTGKLTHLSDKLINEEPQYSFYNIQFATSEAADYAICLAKSSENSWYWKGRDLHLNYKENFSENEIAIMLVNRLYEVFSPEIMDISAKYSRLTSKNLPFEFYNKRAIQFSPQYRILLSLFLGEGSHDLRGWEIESAIAKYLQPLIQQLSQIMNLSVESQVQYFVDDPPVYFKEGEYRTAFADFPKVVNNFEKYLSVNPNVREPTLHFVLYVPPKEIQPLKLEDQYGKEVATNSMLLPQWGSIIITNTNNSASNYLQDSDMKSQFRTISRDLLLLLGVDDFLSFSLSPVVMERMLRQRIAESLVGTTDTLLNLAKLIKSIENMAVPKEIQSYVKEALKSLDLAYNTLSERKLNLTLSHSTNAFEKAQKALFHSSMVTTVYFPDESKYGIYAPLFAPIMIPLILSLVKEIRGALKSMLGSFRRRKASTNETNDL